MKAGARFGWLLMLWWGVALASGPDILHRGLGPAPDSLYIHRAQGLSAFNLLRDLHEGLLTLDSHARPVAGLASRWSVSDDRRLWTFELRSDARWSDGTAITADDFVRSFGRLLDPATASPAAGWFAAIDRVEAPSAGQLRLWLSTSLPWFEYLLTLPAAAPLPASDTHYSGYYRLVAEYPGSRFVLERNRFHHAAGADAPERVEWHVIEDTAAEMARFRSGELHITESVPPGRRAWLEKQFGSALRIAPYLGSFYLVVNLRQPPLAEDRRLRQALSLAIDREILSERVLGSGERPAWRLVPPGLPGWPDPEPPVTTFAQRVDQARKLLAEAGYGPDRPLTVELRVNSSLTNRRLAAAVAAMWKQHLGVITRQVHEEWKVFVVNRRQGRITQIVRGGWIADWPDAQNFLELFRSNSPMNYAFFRDQRFDALLSEAAGRSGQERIRPLLQAEQRLLDEQVIIPLYYYVSRHLVHPDVSGWHDNPMDLHLSRWLSLEGEG